MGEDGVQVCMDALNMMATQKTKNHLLEDEGNSQ